MTRLKAILPPLLGLGLMAALLLNLGLDWHALFSGDLSAASLALGQAAQQAGPEKTGWFLLLIALLPFALVPITVVLLATATLLPPLDAFAVILAGTALNTALSFWIGKHYGLRLFAIFKPERYEFYAALKGGAREHGFKMGLVSRCLPMPFCFAGVAAPMLGIRFSQIMLGTLVCMLPWSVFYVFFTESVRQGNLRFLAPALGLLALILALLEFARRSLKIKGDALPEGPMLPQEPPLGPELTLYTLPQHEPCQDARQELWALRTRLKFEVREIDISVSPALDTQFHDHVPVLFLGKQKLFSFQVDENALDLYLRKQSRD